MATIAVWLKLDEEHATQALRDAGERLDGAGGEVVLDFSCVRRLQPHLLDAMEELLVRADHKGIEVAVRGVDVHVYKVLKLMRLASRFSFTN